MFMQEVIFFKKGGGDKKNCVGYEFLVWGTANQSSSSIQGRILPKIANFRLTGSYIPKNGVEFRHQSDHWTGVATSHKILYHRQTHL